MNRRWIPTRTSPLSTVFRSRLKTTLTRLSPGSQRHTTHYRGCVATVNPQLAANTRAPSTVSSRSTDCEMSRRACWRERPVSTPDYSTGRQNVSTSRPGSGSTLPWLGSRPTASIRRQSLRETRRRPPTRRPKAVSSPRNGEPCGGVMFLGSRCLRTNSVQPTTASRRDRCSPKTG